MKVAVVGSGAWGTALALQLHRNGHETALLAHRESSAEIMRSSHRNPRLPNAILPEDMQLSADYRLLRDCRLVVFASPSFPLRDVCRKAAPFIAPDAVLVSVTKGLEQGSHLRMSQVISQELGGRSVVVLTGPSHAEEVSLGLPTGCLAASENQTLAEFVQDAFMSDRFRIYTSPDPVGAELGAAMKNVIALCAGISDGLGFGDNTKAMLMTRGLTETARLGRALGAQKETFAGLAGVGDLIVTCTSLHSRNRRAGILIGQGKSPREAMEEVGAVVEGYYATNSVYELSSQMGIEAPIIHAAYQVLYENADVRSTVQTLLTRQRKAEHEDAGWL